MASDPLPSLNCAETLVRRDMPNILLSHNPNIFPSVAAAGIEVSLAGHTHGGQVNFEILNKSWSPARFMTDFVAGLLPVADGYTGKSVSCGKSQIGISLCSSRHRDTRSADPPRSKTGNHLANATMGI
jgi:hypothetical protein